MTSNKNMQTQKYLELAEHINQLFPQFRISAAEFGNLAPNRITEFFRMLLEEFNVSIETVLKTILDKCTYPAAFQNIVSVCVIYTYSVALFQEICGQRLPLSDFLKFGSRRACSRIKLSANFYCYFNNTFYDKLKPIQDNIHSECNFLQDVHNILDAIKGDSNRTAQEIFNYERSVVKINEKKKKLFLQCSENVELESKLIEENKKQKEILTNLEKEELPLSQTLENELERQKKIKILIVNDYDELVAERNKHKIELIQLQPVGNECNENIKIKMDCDAKYDKVISTINNVTESYSLPELLQKYHSIKSIETLINKSAEEHTRLLLLRNDIQTEQQDLNKEKVNLNTESQTCKLKRHTSKASLICEVHDLQKDYDNIVNKKENVIKLIAEYEKQNEFAKRCVRQHETDSKGFFEFCQKQYKKILESKGDLDTKVNIYLKELKRKSSNITFTTE